jgi:predicted transcriptional regulator
MEDAGVNAREHTVKVDPETSGRIADLAHFLGKTRKDVVRDALMLLADLQAPAVSRGIERSEGRATAASGSLDAAKKLADVGGDLLALAPRERVSVLRTELIDLLDRHGARNPRIVGALAHDADTEHLELLVESDLIDGIDHPGALHVTQRLLGMTVTLHDETRLRLFSPEKLRRLASEAVPL